MATLSVATKCQRLRRIPFNLRRLAAGEVAITSTTTTQGSHHHVIQRHKSSLFANFPLPASLQESVKTSILDKVTRDDHKIWSAPYPNGVNGKYNENIRNGEHGRNSSTSNINSRADNILGSVNEEISAWHHDPLDDLYLKDETTTYWPNLPPNVRETADPMALTQLDVDSLSTSIRTDLLGTDHPVLNQAASYFFGTADGGKKIRPLMVMLLSRALSDTVSGLGTTNNTNNNNAEMDMNLSTTTSSSSPSSSSPSLFTGFETSLFTHPLSWQRQDLPQAQRRLAEISEMIHTASLFHDDVIDGSETRRGVSSVHMVFGNKMAILAGDYLLARASISLARLRHVEVVECMSTIIEHLVRGEVMQMRGTTTSEGSQNERMIYYLKKNYYKTGSLMANSCKSAALLADCPAPLVVASYKYGKHFGMAFQLVDDVLDFEGDVKSMGKPAFADLRAGLSTAPVLFAAEESPELEVMMDRKFKEEGDLEKARELVLQSRGIERTKELARVHAERAMEAVLPWNDSVHRDALINLAYRVVQRTH
ncbi:solanesyl diphosphate synthase [Nitzschia inconspicua]|uniref:Solanesyl diphosphate synthase n=1 Tax=Nitzschia inconspicua TaxID=303405 RepID=A0A9K3PWW5_9STRA|nr:solanesyl diphosphate synthase [Nitzschia inconspicua]